ncbi:MAG: phage holin, LLH family, partial [Treponema sp.]|nr:phage holin, LLH family [Treponema sp.]MDY5758365.1 phage holin, LLH family [Treponema sp.]
DITETAVRWAKQWLDTATGAEKKEEVLRYLEEKTSELGLNITADDIDKAIEAAYEKVKKETESK